MTSILNNIYRPLLIVVASQIGFGCAEVQKKIDNKPEVSAETKQKISECDYSGAYASDGIVSIRILKSILPGDPKFIGQTDSWGEYVFEVKTLTQSSITYKSISIIGNSGSFISPAASYVELTKTPNLTNDFLIMAGGGAAVTVASFAAGSVLLGPLAFVGYSAYELTQLDNTIKAEEEFLKRVDAKVKTIDGYSTHVSSVFFPLVANAKAIVIGYATGSGATKEIKLPLSGKLLSKDNNSLQPVANNITSNQTDELSILDIQNILKKLKYYSGAVDGKHGKATVAAIRGYQQANRLQISGVVDRETMELLRKEKVKLAAIP